VTKTDRIQLTAERVLGAVRVLSARDGGKPSAVNLYDIVTQLLGFNPLTGKDTDTRYRSKGAKSKDAWINEHLSMAHLRKLLDELIEQQELVKVTDPSRFDKSAAAQRLRRAVTFPFRIQTGYVPADAYHAALTTGDAAGRDDRRRVLLGNAKEELAKLHEAELQAIYRRLCEAEGLAAARETPDPDKQV
jgi:hypothetical protein